MSPSELIQVGFTRRTGREPARHRLLRLLLGSPAGTGAAGAGAADEGGQDGGRPVGIGGGGRRGFDGRGGGFGSSGRGGGQTGGSGGGRIGGRGGDDQNHGRGGWGRGGWGEHVSGRGGGRAPERGHRHRAGPLSSWRTLAGVGVLGLVAAAGASALLLSRPSPPVSVALAVLLVAIGAGLGWLAGESRRSRLRGEIEHRTSELGRALTELEVAQAETVRRLSMAVEFRDEDTGAHIERIGRFSALLAAHLGMDPDFCERVSHAAPLHDVGKVAIPDAILLKPGPLTEQERAIVETHTEEGHRLLRGSSSSILDLAASIALSHHEKWDGSGYPRGLVGEAIPIEGRIVAIADVFDALTSDRVYRKAFPVQDAVAMMIAERGRHFDPTLLDAFLEVLDSTGPQARERRDASPGELVSEVFSRYAAAVQRGDAETAEGVIVQAIEDGVPPAMLHEDVIGASMRLLRERFEHGVIDGGTRTLAVGISRRILATMHRYMLRHDEPDRERVLIVGIEDEDSTLVLQMIHDQLEAAGFDTTLELELGAQRAAAAIQAHPPDALVLGAGDPAAANAAALLLDDLRQIHPALPVALSGPVVVDEVRRREGISVIERVDEAVETVTALLRQRAGSLRS